MLPCLGFKFPLNDLCYHSILYTCVGDIILTQLLRCCIDKTSTAELSEAINSMYRWYRKAKVCYVYLADVDYDPAIELWKDPKWVSTQDSASIPKDYSFANSRWFTRGWTLQELLAPSDVQFYSRTSQLLGSKRNLCALLSLITNILEEALSRPDPLEDSICFVPGRFSISTRMSWAARRQTTRIEDTAYCLLGLFDINMPLIYGEGEKAFRRLQEEIMKSSDDQSLFAWGPVSPVPLLIGSYEHVKLLKRQGKSPPRSLFAKSPLDFANSEFIVPHSRISQGHDFGMPPMMMSGGVRITLPVLSYSDPTGKLTGLQLAEAVHMDDIPVIAILDCYSLDNSPSFWDSPDNKRLFWDSSPSLRLGVPLYSSITVFGTYFFRVGELVIIALTANTEEELVKRRKVLYIKSPYAA